MTPDEQEAADPKTSPHRLQSLSVSREAGVRRLVAKNPNAPVAALISLSSEHPNEVVQNPSWALLFLENPSVFLPFDAEQLEFIWRYVLPESFQAALSLHADVWVLRYLLRSPGTTWELRERLMERALASSDEALTAGIAEEENIPLRHLQRLLRHHSSEVRASAAQNQNLPPLLLARTALNDEVAQYAARNPTTPLFVLERISRSQREERRRSVVNNIHCSAEILQRLARDPSVSVRIQVAGHPKISVSTMRVLAEDLNVHVRRWVASHAHCPTDVLAQMFALDDASETLLSNPNAPAHHLKRFAKSQDAHLRRGVARNPRCPIEVARMLLHDPDSEVRRMLAIYQSAPEILQQLSRDKTPEVASAAIQNQALPASALPGLMKSSEPKIRAAIARSDQAPATLLAELSLDSDPEVAANVAANKNSSPDTLAALSRRPELHDTLRRNPKTPNKRQLYQEEQDDSIYDLDDPSAELRYLERCPANAHHVATSSLHPETLRHLAGHIGCGVRASVAKNPLCPVELLRALSQDQALDVRAAVAENPRCPVEILSRLAQDDEARVCRAASKNPSTPLDALWSLIHMGYGDQVQRGPSWPMESFTQERVDELLRLGLEGAEGRWRLDFLCSHEDEHVRILAASSALGAHLAERLSRDPSFVVRVALLANPSIQRAMRERLLTQERSRLRDERQGNPSFANWLREMALLRLSADVDNKS